MWLIGLYGLFFRVKREHREISCLSRVRPEHLLQLFNQTQGGLLDRFGHSLIGANALVQLAQLVYVAGTQFGFPLSVWLWYPQDLAAEVSVQQSLYGVQRVLNSANRLTHSILVPLLLFSCLVEQVRSQAAVLCFHGVSCFPVLAGLVVFVCKRIELLQRGRLLPVG